MKKHYIRIAIVIETLILIVAILGLGFYTYVLAEREMRVDLEQAQYATYNRMPSYNCDDPAKLVRDAYCYFWYLYDFVHYGATGFYSYIKLNDGTTFDTTRDYCFLQLDEGDANTIPYEERILFIEEEGFDTVGHLYDPEFNSECDGLFVHGGTMNYQNKTYEIGDVDYSAGEMTTVEEWSGGLYILGNYIRMADNDREAKLNNDAKKLFDELYPKMLNGEYVDSEVSNIWTSYRLDISVSPAGTYIVVQIFHPVEYVINLHKGIYILVIALLIAAEVLIAFVISKLCKSRMEFEAKSRRLTRGVAHELKTPLAVTKAYMENWDYIDEEDRDEYARKINREIDDMTSLINALLEMDKINSGSLKLNMEEIDISALLWSVYNHVRPLAMERNLKVIMPETEEIMIKADLKFMKIALSNYLTNMVKYADKKAEVQIINEEKTVWIKFRNDSSNEKKNKTDKLNSNGMGVEINENIMKLHGFKYGSSLGNRETVFWFEAKKI